MTLVSFFFTRILFLLYLDVLLCLQQTKHVESHKNLLQVPTFKVYIAPPLMTRRGEKFNNIFSSTVPQSTFIKNEFDQTNEYPQNKEE